MGHHGKSIERTCPLCGTVVGTLPHHLREDCPAAADVGEALDKRVRE